MCNVYPFPFAVSVHLKCPCHSVVKFWLSGSFRVRVGVRTSLVNDTENETVLTAPCLLTFVVATFTPRSSHISNAKFTHSLLLAVSLAAGRQAQCTTGQVQPP